MRKYIYHIIVGVAAMGLTSCDDLFEPALENNKDISEMQSLK